jgi:hypothetical protein
LFHFFKDIFEVKNINFFNQIKWLFCGLNFSLALKEKGRNTFFAQSMVSQKLLKELQNIIQEDYDLNLTEKEISELGNLLVDSFKILLGADNKKLLILPNKKP